MVKLPRSLLKIQLPRASESELCVAQASKNYKSLLNANVRSHFGRVTRWGPWVPGKLGWPSPCPWKRTSPHGPAVTETTQCLPSPSVSTTPLRNREEIQATVSLK